MLFDTGWNSNDLKHNLDKMDINTRKIKHVFISHDHWDHTGGLKSIIRHNNTVEILGLSSFSNQLKETISKHLIEFRSLERPSKIHPNIHSTGKLETTYDNIPIDEHALIVKNRNNNILLTGCAHPGIVKITKRAKNILENSIDIVIGAFHLKDKENDKIKSIAKELKEIGVKKIGPTHCTGESAIKIFRNYYSSRCLEVKTGITFKL